MASGYDNNNNDEQPYMDSIDCANAERQRLFENGRRIIDEQIEKDARKRAEQEEAVRYMRYRRTGSYMTPEEKWDFYKEELPVYMCALLGVALGFLFDLKAEIIPLLGIAGFCAGAFVKYNAFKNLPAAESFHKSIPYLLAAAVMFAVYIILLYAA